MWKMICISLSHQVFGLLFILLIVIWPNTSWKPVYLLKFSEKPRICVLNSRELSVELVAASKWKFQPQFTQEKLLFWTLLFLIYHYLSAIAACPFSKHTDNNNESYTVKFSFLKAKTLLTSPGFSTLNAVFSLDTAACKASGCFISTGVHEGTPPLGFWFSLHFF